MLKERQEHRTSDFYGDDWDPYKNALIEVYGVPEQPEYKGRGRPPNPKKVPPPDLLYAQVIKHKKNDEVVSIEKRVVFGKEEEEILNTLEQNGNTVNTSYVERNNLTARNGASRLIRDTINDALKIEIADGIRRWKQRTPAMAANITDHIWKLEELFNVKPPPDG